MLATSGLISQALALLTFLLCVGFLAWYLVITLRQSWPAQLAEGTGTKEEYARLNAFYKQEFTRQQMGPDQRTIVLKSCGLLAGLAIGFLALTLFFGAARLELERSESAVTGSEWPVPATPSIPGTSAPVEKMASTLSFSVRFAPFIPSIVGLICATFILSAALSDNRPAGPQIGYSYSPAPYLSSPTPPAETGPVLP